MEFADYEGLYATGHENRTPTKPEDEFFHSVYIAGQQRTNHTGETEQIGKLQIRGVEYNKDKVHFVITHVKNILAKIVRNSTTGKDNVDCFSYQEGQPPWTGMNNRICGTTSAERAANEFCRECRAQIIVAGIYCNEGGKPYLSEEGKPTFIFFRGKGMKYSGVSEYLNEMSQLTVDAKDIVTPPTDPEKLALYERFVKAVINNKKYVTQLEVGTAKSQHGDKMVFKLSKGSEIPDTAVKDVLTVAKKTMAKFNEKMNWSRKTPSGPAGSQIPTSAPPAGSEIPAANTKPEETVSSDVTTETVQTESKSADKASEGSFTFDDVGF